MDTFELRNKTDEAIQVKVGEQQLNNAVVPINKIIRPGEGIVLEHDLAIIAERMGLTPEAGAIPPLPEKANPPALRSTKPQILAGDPVIETKKSKVEKAPEKKPDYKEMKVNELKSLMEKRRIPIQVGAKKRDLIKVLETADKTTPKKKKKAKKAGGR